MKFNLFSDVFSQFKSCHWWCVLFWIALVAPAQASVLLRVSIERGVSQIKVGSSTKGFVRDYSTGRTLGQITAMNAFYAQPSAGGVTVNQMHSSAIWISPTAGGYVYIGEHWYSGQTLVVPTNKGLTAVNYVDLEQYLYSVVGSEVFYSWPLEALKAQAVAARTYALYERQNAKNVLYDLGDTPYWQAYKGVETEAASTYAAVNATSGQVLTYKGQIIESQFHNCSGGHTENVEDVWGNYLPYLRGVEGYDEGVIECEWVKTFSPNELNRRISRVGVINSLRPTLTTYGSIKTMEVVGTQGTQQLSGEDLRLALDLKSSRFNIKQDLLGLRFEGRGWGHGVGMSQWGAYYLAKHGVKYRQILGHYYHGTSLARIQVH